ncbi:sel1 repeat family protein [Pararhizobium sp. BT-229]|uniref:tetratricopeptide repeat protein n=1 Tax=Pararhizobium sp. BT-229 TaxID=2986923 RepID=UPI0021F785D4|nr:tetratricopeptide repeat protein [Pararhizobium sp. BT-229]MCV9964917.1 sel1 repeat family protein [Pararhizobium sp. BT-229]
MFIVSNADHAKRVGKKLAEALKKYGVSVTRVASLDLIARMWGYRNFAEIKQGSSELPSPYDEDCSDAIRNERMLMQAKALREYGVKEAAIMPILAEVRPTSRQIREGAVRERLGADATIAAVEKARRLVAMGEADNAIYGLTDALQSASQKDRSEIVSELDRLSEDYDLACYNIGMAYIIGDAGSRDLNKAKAYMERGASMRTGSAAGALILSVLGDFASGNHGGPANPDLAMSYYKKAALTKKAPQAAFNCGLRYDSAGDHELAAEFYKLGMEGGHAPSMTNWALMLMDGRLPKNLKVARMLLDMAERLGDSKASNVLRMFEAISRPKEPSSFAEIRDIMGNYVPPVVAEIIPARLWAKILTQHDWKLSSINTSLRFEWDVLAIATTSDGRDFPIHATHEMHVPGAPTDKVLERFERHFGGRDAVLLFSHVVAISDGNDSTYQYVCLGMVRVDGEWSDAYLEPGGLDAVLRQPLALKTNPQLVKSVAFRCPGGDVIAASVDAATKRLIDKV